ncbi:hypothetical protein BDV23DRAFT_178825 [Aspergillus alliaceus]|uniref:RRM domain-containing protein n=1 Tax=Petromyces alliaceus TaxID=209559 RepID=A0A5N7CP50_PETAA|nr:hypothetical protein BDV23DRAFT_178825 [Aspergillus alliaceus]
MSAPGAQQLPVPNSHQPEQSLAEFHEYQSRYGVDARLFIGNLPNKCTREELAHNLCDIFSQCGECRVRLHTNTQNSLVGAFVQFTNAQAAETAFNEKNGTRILHRPLRVEKAMGPRGNTGNTGNRTQAPGLQMGPNQPLPLNNGSVAHNYYPAGQAYLYQPDPQPNYMPPANMGGGVPYPMGHPPTNRDYLSAQQWKAAPRQTISHNGYYCEPNNDHDYEPNNGHDLQPDNGHIWNSNVGQWYKHEDRFHKDPETGRYYDSLIPGCYFENGLYYGPKNPRDKSLTNGEIRPAGEHTSSPPRDDDMSTSTSGASTAPLEAESAPTSQVSTPPVEEESAVSEDEQTQAVPVSLLGLSSGVFDSLLKERS